MSLAKTYSAQTTLLKAHIIDIEVDLSRGLHSFAVVGLPDKAVEESRDRVSAAIKNSGFTSPKNKNQKVVISLAPADLKKEGPIFDLGMAMAYLLSSEDIKFDPEGILFLGELSLDGTLRKIPGVLPLVVHAREKKFKEVFVPIENAREAALIEGITIYGARSLAEVVEHLNIKKKKEDSENGKEVSTRISAQPRTQIEYKDTKQAIGFEDIKGQELAKRGLEIAAAGGHNIALFGPPGTGKTMLARAFCGLLPRLSFDEILEVTSIHSVSGILSEHLVVEPPFRSPHHTSSYVSLVGGGSIPKPGEITLAHHGVLFLDEFPEFDRKVIDTLRQPLEERVISVSRARGTAHFPAHFILVAAMNPCPCGNYGTKEKECVCTSFNLIKYQRKISGPIIERIDLWIEVGRINHNKLTELHRVGEETEAIKERVAMARNIQQERFKKLGLKATMNSDMTGKDLLTHIPLKSEVIFILNTSAEKLDLSPRVYHRIWKIARTIADLDHAEDIETKHMLEALQYRPKKLN